MYVAGFKIIASSHCTTRVPVRRHKRRKGQSRAYHERVQKKWIKRFGLEEKPTAYQVNRSFLGHSGPVLFAHPSIVEKLKAKAEPIPHLPVEISHPFHN